MNLPDLMALLATIDDEMDQYKSTMLAYRAAKLQRDATAVLIKRFGGVAPPYPNITPITPNPHPIP